GERRGIEAIRGENDVGAHDEFGIGNNARFAASARVGFAEFHANTTNAADFSIVPFDSNWIGEERKLRAFFNRVLIFLFAARHVGEVAAINAGRFERAAANGRAQTIHRGVAASEYRDALSFDGDLWK